MNKVIKISCLLSTVFVICFLGMSATAHAYSRPTLYLWSQNSYVAEAQRILNAYENAHLDTDGIYGPKTRQAVMCFQAKYGLQKDGICGPQTWNKLLSLGNSSGTGSVATKFYAYGGKKYTVPANFDLRYVYKQTTNRNCTQWASNTAVSIARNTLYKNTGWNGGCTWRDRNTGASLFYSGYDKTTAGVKLSKVVELVRAGQCVVLRLGSDSPGHSVCVVGIREGAVANRIAYADILVADPADGKIRTLSELSKLSWFHGGVLDYRNESTRWALLVPKEAPASIMQGFSVK